MIKYLLQYFRRELFLGSGTGRHGRSDWPPWSGITGNLERILQIDIENDLISKFEKLTIQKLLKKSGR